MERRIVRKQDWHIMPLICLSYLLSATNLGNARTINSDKPGESLVEVLDLKGLRYNIIVAVFFIPYVLLEFPSNLALKYFTPSKWIARIMISWGIVTVCSAAVFSYAGLIAVRIALGIAEAGFFPGVIFYLCLWYKTDERATRMSIFASSVAVSGAFGGLIAAGVSYMSGKAGLHGWQWLFVLEGIPAILLGVVVWFCLPDFPETAKWLTPDERAFAAHRMGPFAPKQSDKHFDKKDAVACVKSWQFWAFAVAYFCFANSLNAAGYFIPTIVQSLGFQGAKAQLLTVPPNAFAAIVIIANSWHSDRTKERSLHILFGTAIVMTGYLLLAVVRHWGVRYVGVFLIACTNAAVMPFLALRTATVTGSTSTAIATGGVIAFSNSAGAVAPFLFPSTDSPLYIMGNWTCFALLGLAALITCALWFLLGGSSEYKGSASFVGVAGENGLEVEDKLDEEASKIKEADAGIRV
ncbi:phthalate transporter [Rhodotorula diobovata]|uniref:Phthalate transporter n=1 Tax=Rhodotorula diobovata TaxID=5288 RepID=A0A5C5FKA8_9BASI|nr:phthalate transporter [Rhodotorula diobovata]